VFPRDMVYLGNICINTPHKGDNDDADNNNNNNNNLIYLKFNTPLARDLTNPALSEVLSPYFSELDFDIIFPSFRF
jgi:hypothetical protein